MDTNEFNLLFNPEAPTQEGVLFRNANEFSMFVESKAIAEECTCTSIVLRYCDEKDLDPDDVAKLINSSLREKIAREMIEDGLMPKGAELEFD